MLKNRRFLRLWSAYSVNTFGDEMYMLAVPLLVYSQGGSASTMALVYSCSLLPQVLFGFLGGVLADRGDRVKLLRLMYFGSAVTLFIAFVGYLSWESGRLLVLATTALALSGLASVSAAGIDSAIPNFVSDTELARANSMTEATRTVATVVGPALAGVLVASAFPESAILINGIAFTVAFLALRRLSLPAPDTPAAGGNIGQDLMEGLRYLVAKRPLFIGVFLSTSANLVFGAYEAILVYYMRADLDLSAAGAGLVMSAAGAASIGAALLLTWRAPAKNFTTIMTAAIFLQGLGVAVIPLGGVGTVVAGQVVLTVFLVVYTVYWRAFRQTICDPRLLGRVSGACRAIAFGGSFLGSLVSSAVLTVAGTRTVLYSIGGITMAIGIFGYVLLANAAPDRAAVRH